MAVNRVTRLAQLTLSKVGAFCSNLGADQVTLAVHPLPFLPWQKPLVRNLEVDAPELCRGDGGGQRHQQQEGPPHRHRGRGQQLCS